METVQYNLLNVEDIQLHSSLHNFTGRSRPIPFRHSFSTVQNLSVRAPQIPIQDRLVSGHRVIR